MAFNLWNTARQAAGQFVALQGASHNFPELNISERISGQSFGAPAPQYTPPQTQIQNITPQYSQPAGPVNPNNYNTPSYAAPKTNGSVLGATYDQGVQNINSQAGDAMSIINEDYDNAMRMLGTQENALRGDAGFAQEQAATSGNRLKSSYAEQAGVQEQGVNSQLSTAETGATSAMRQARDLFRQTQQSNIAQLSALGISSSSVSEALAERLGVETARRIAGVTGSLQEVRQNATTEIKNIRNFVAKRNTEIDEQVEAEKKNIQRQMMQGLEQINNQRYVASTERARGRANIMAQVQNNIFSLTQQATQWKQQLDQWEKTQSATVYQSVGDLERSLGSAANTFSQNPQFSKLEFTPSMSINQYGRVSGSLTGKKKPAAYTDPISGQGYDENGEPV